MSFRWLGRSRCEITTDFEFYKPCDETSQLLTIRGEDENMRMTTMHYRDEFLRYLDPLKICRQFRTSFNDELI